MSTNNRTKNGVVEVAEVVPTLQQLDAKIAYARRAKSELIKSMVIGSFAAIYPRFLHHSEEQD